MKGSTKNLDCEAAQDLLLKEAGGRELSEAESELLRSHAARCRECREEAMLFGLLAYRTDDDSPLDPADGRRRSEILDGAVNAYLAGDRPERSPAPSPAFRPLRALAVAAAAALLLVAAYLLLFRDAGRESMDGRWSLTITGVVGEASAGVASLTKGVVVGTGDRLTLGAGAFAELSDRESCRLFLLEGTEIVVGGQGEGLRELDLRAGTLVAETGGGPAGCGLAVRAGDATVRNVGTLFSVERSAEERIVRVVSGKVVVTTAAGMEWKVHAGEKLFIGSGGRGAGKLPVGEATVIREAAAGRFLPAPPTGGEGEGSTAPPPASRTEGSSPGMEGAEGEQSAAKKPHKADKAPADAAGMLKHARQLRKDKDWDGAVEVYLQIMDLHPGSAEAGVAEISLGEIYLENKGNPANALKYFNAYRAANPAGSLFKEASYGAIRCYRKMGQGDKEAAEIEKFLEKFPEDLYSKKLKQRLEDMESEETE